MEKITYQPLIDHLKKEAGTYNAQYQTHELQRGSIDKKLLTEWIVEVGESIVIGVESVAPGNVQRVFPPVYQQILSFLSGSHLMTEPGLYKQILLLGQYAPTPMATAPNRLLKAFVSAAKTIHRFQPGKVGAWLHLMQRVLPFASSVDDCLHIGRINAWLCGMAHLRQRALDSYRGLPFATQSAFSELDIAEDFSSLFDTPWSDLVPNDEKGICLIGHFSGFNGGFDAPPVLANVNDHVFATDGKNHYAVFADRFGCILLAQKSVDENDVFSAAQTIDLQPHDIRFDDVYSATVHRDTLFLTRSSSHHVYVFPLNRQSSIQ